MNKFISAAAFLAASTVLASAGTVITLTDLGQDATAGNITYSASSGYLSGSDLFYSYTIGTDNRTTASTTISLDLTALGMATSGSSYSSTTLLLNQQLSTTDTSGSIGLAATSLGIQLTWEGSVWQNGDNHLENIGISWDTLRTKSHTKDGNTYVVLTLVSPARLNGTSTSVGAGTSVYDEDGQDFAWINTSNNRTGTGYGYSGLVSRNVYSAIYVDTDYVSAVSVFAGAASSEEIAKASSAIIPEPSAFGLLAGAGALALVAARRRRSRKA